MSTEIKDFQKGCTYFKKWHYFTACNHPKGKGVCSKEGCPNLTNKKV